MNEPGKLDPVRLMAVFFVAALVSLAVLWRLGLGNDQALFDYYASRMIQGAVLYHDIWDNKQPGIFLWYVVSELLFGKGWEGLRLSLALWDGLAAAVASALCMAVRPGSRAWWIAPVLTVGVSLMRIDAERPGQVESLIDLPMMLIVALLLIPPLNGRREWVRWLLVGAVTGAVASLKLVLAPVAAAMIAVALLWRWFHRRSGVGELFGIGTAMAIGFLAVLAPLFGYFQSKGVLGAFLWTMWTYPRLALKEVPTQHIEMLISSFKWLLVTSIPMALGAAIATVRACRKPRTIDSLFVFTALAWIVAGTVMIVMQKFSWWNTHMDLIDWPIGLIGALGLTSQAGDGASLLADFRGGGSWLRAALVVAALGTALHFARFIRDEGFNPDWPKPRQEIEALQTARQVAASQPAPCGTAYAIGDQAGVERATGLMQALNTHGLWFGAFLKSQIDSLPGELAQARPDLVYFDSDHRRDFAQRSPATLKALDAWLARDYEPVTTDAFGSRWWHRRDASPGGPCQAIRPFEIPRP